MNPTILDYISAAIAARAGGGYRPQGRIQGAPTSTNNVWTVSDAWNKPVGQSTMNLPFAMGNVYSVEAPMLDEVDYTIGNVQNMAHNVRRSRR